MYCHSNKVLFHSETFNFISIMIYLHVREILKVLPESFCISCRKEKPCLFSFDFNVIYVFICFFSLQRFYLRFDCVSSFKMANKYLENVGNVDVISDAEVYYLHEGFLCSIL